MSSSGSSGANFDRVADVYRWVEYLMLGPLLVRTRNHFLSALADRKSTIAFGDGDGRFLKALLQRNPMLSAIAVDTSKRMLAILMRRCCENRARLSTVQSSALSIKAAAETDLIITHFFLDCLTQQECETLMQNIAVSVQTGTRWLISEFRVPTKQPMRLIGRVYIKMLYFAFRLTTGLRVQSLPDYQTPLGCFGFLRIARKEFLFGMLHTELWELREVPEPRKRTTATKMESST